MQSDIVLERLMALHPKIIDLSLERMWRLLDKLDHPEQKLPPVIHVAGTNGKGSLIAYLRAILEAAGYRVHTYISPHLVRFNERIRLGGELISEQALSDLLAHCEQANGGENITYFEITTAAALEAFAQTPADILLLETGLGGRLDATNVIARPALTAITPVSLDHHQYLGTTITEIAAEKAGIIKPEVPVIVGPQSAQALAVIENKAAQMSAPVFAFGQDWNCSVSDTTAEWIYESNGDVQRYPLPNLAGNHQIANAATALACLENLKDFDVKSASIEAGLQNVEWPARMQRLRSGPIFDALPDHVEVWLDGGHNAAAAEQIRNSFESWNRAEAKPTFLVCAMLNTKNQEAFFRQLTGFIEFGASIPVTGEAASTPPDLLAEFANNAGLSLSPAASLDAAVNLLQPRLSAQPCRLLIAGSLYMAGDILKTHS